MTIRKYTNEKGESVEFGRNTPYKVISIDGESAIQNVITSSKNYAQDGESINAMALDIRPILIQGRLTARSKSELETHRRKLIRVFSPKLKGRYVKLDSAVEYQVECVVEFAPHFASVVRNDKSVNFQISLICPDPYWQSVTESETEIVTWIGGLEFPLVFPTQFSTAGEKRINVINAGDVETPIRVEIAAPATNPKLTHIGTGEFIRIKRELTGNDVLVVTTDFGNKRVEIDGVSKFNYIDQETTFFSLLPGDNILEYTSDDEQEKARVRISYKNRYLGV